jgi:EmrB/QacA subfamily drug resistance transporter
MADETAAGEVRLSSPSGRWIVATAVLGSAVVALDATVVNVALPTIGRDLHAGIAGLQWTIDAYLVTLAALILPGGSLGDRFGRRRIFLAGLAWFAIASLGCGIAPNIGVLIAARTFQGIGGALLTPASLAIIQAAFHPADRGRAIGAWSGLGGLATAAGPLAGGWLVDAVSWRVIFLLNLPMAVIAGLAAARHVPESTDPTVAGRVDVPGAALVTVGLAAVTYGLIEGPSNGWQTATIMTLVVGLAALAAFVVVERREAHPMLPLDIFTSRQFTGANLATFAIYAALGGVFFLFVVFLQTSLGYSPLKAGAASLPITIIMLMLSSRAGALSQRIGPRRPMTIGPMIVALGIVAMARINPGDQYATVILPAVVVFGLGLALTVAPLTATVLAAADVRHAGVASGVNNAVARAAGLLAVAALPPIAGIAGADYRRPVALTHGFHTAALVGAGLALAGGVISWFTIRDGEPFEPPAADHHDSSCSIDAPPLRSRVA